MQEERRSSLQDPPEIESSVETRSREGELLTSSGAELTPLGESDRLETIKQNCPTAEMPSPWCSTSPCYKGAQRHAGKAWNPPLYHVSRSRAAGTSGER